MPRVALIYPYFRTRGRNELLFAPLGVAALAGQLRELGIEVEVFDGTFSTFEELGGKITAYAPDVAGIYCMITLSQNTFRIAQMIRSELPDCLLAAGGPLPTLYPKHFANLFDAVFRGEAEVSFPRFCKAYLEQKNFSRVNLSGLALGQTEGLYIDHAKLHIDTAPIHHSEAEINAYPPPYRGDFDHAAYQQAGMERDGRKTTSIITTYGCPYECDFCSKPIFGQLFRRRYLDRVFQEIDQIKELGYDTLWIADDNFTLDSEYLLTFCDRMSKSNGDRVGWSCLSRVTNIHAALVRAMKEAGCSKVYLGLESGSPETLRLMNKRATLDEAVDAIHTFRGNGIEVGAFFIVGYPGETAESIDETFRFALEQQLNEISFNVPFPLPGSKLFERVSGLQQDKDWNLENEVTFVYRSEFDQEWLRGRIEETLLSFSEKNHK